MLNMSWPLRIASEHRASIDAFDPFEEDVSELLSQTIDNPSTYFTPPLKQRNTQSPDLFAGDISTIASQTQSIIWTVGSPDIFSEAINDDAMLTNRSGSRMDYQTIQITSMNEAINEEVHVAPLSLLPLAPIDDVTIDIPNIKVPDNVCHSASMLPESANMVALECAQNELNVHRNISRRVNSLKESQNQELHNATGTEQKNKSPDIFDDEEEPIIAPEESTVQVLSNHTPCDNSTQNQPMIVEPMNDNLLQDIHQRYLFSQACGSPQSPRNEHTYSINRPVLDETHITTPSVQSVTHDAETTALLNTVQKWIQALATAAEQNEKVQMMIPRRTWDNCEYTNGILRLRQPQHLKMRNIHSCHRLTIIRYLLNEIHRQLDRKLTCTFRELYYRDPELMDNQRKVNGVVNEICCMLHVKPWQIGIFASSKGLLAGQVRMTLLDDSVICCEENSEGILLPHSTAKMKDLKTHAYFVLVVEKETIFRKMLKNNVIARLGGGCLIITGKGYPDMNTRIFLRKLWLKYQLPIYILTDADPFGIEIMLTYRHGSMSLAYCNEDLAVPSIKWLGVYPSDIAKFGLHTIPLKHQDVAKIEKVMSRPSISHAVYQELVLLKRINHKSEIEGIADASSSYLIDIYLKQKLSNNP